MKEVTPFLFNCSSDNLVQSLITFGRVVIASLEVELWLLDDLEWSNMLVQDHRLAADGFLVMKR